MSTHIAPAPGSSTIELALKIWRYDAETGEKELKRYEVEAPDWVTLLDVLDIIKDQQDGTLAYRKSCRMMICGSCGMRMDGAAVLACKTRMYDIAKSGHEPVISPMGNLPVRKDLVVDMDPFWNKIRAVKPWLDPGYDEVAEKERVVSQQQMNVIHKEALCIMCGCCVSECNSMESDPEFLGPVVTGLQPRLHRVELRPERVHVDDEVLDDRHVPHRRDHRHVAAVDDRLHPLLAGQHRAPVHAHPAGAADHHPAALAVGERAVVLVLDQVEHVEQAGPLRRVDLVLAQGPLAGLRIEPPDLERDDHE